MYPEGLSAVNNRSQGGPTRVLLVKSEVMVLLVVEEWRPSSGS